MSLYTFATASLTTTRDRSRHPAASRAQIARTLLLVLAAAALALLHRQGLGAEPHARDHAAMPERAGDSPADSAPGWPVAARQGLSG